MKKLNEKNLSFEDCQTHWCPSMDLIGISSNSDNLIEVYRCGLDPTNSKSKL